MYRFTAVLCAVLLAGCATAPAPDPQPIFVPMDPVPSVYEVWYADLQECAGIERPFDDIRFFRADDRHMDAEGLWTPPNLIFIAASRVYHRTTVVHEMLHYLRQADGKDAHSDAAFVTCT